MRKIALLAFGVAVATSASGLTAHSYVQKGLKASYDGIDNAGTGTHDATVRTWKDLTGNENDSVTVNGQGYVMKTTLDGVTGYWYQNSPGTMMLFR